MADDRGRSELVDLIVDSSVCSGHGRCYTKAPDLLSADGEGFVTPQDSPIPVSPDHEAKARAAVASCPESAIALIS